LSALKAEYAELLQRRVEIEIALNNKMKIDEATIDEQRQKLEELKPLIKKKESEIEAIEGLLEKQRETLPPDGEPD
jgi:hypothetical protein